MSTYDLPSTRFIREQRSVPHRCRYRFAAKASGCPEAVALEFLRPGAVAPYAIIDYRTSPATVRHPEELP